MRYWGPINSDGGILGDDGYVNGNPSIGQQGSIPTFQTFEQTMRELQNFIVACGLTPDDVMDGVQVAQAIQSCRVNYSLDTGTANALVATLDPIPFAIQNGLMARVIKTAAANTTTTPTLNTNGFGPATIVDRRGNALTAGDLPASGSLEFMFVDPSWRYLGVVKADFGQARAAFNILQQGSSTRTRYNNISGFQTIFSNNYTKTSATSDLVIRFSTNLYSDSPPSGAAAAIMRTTFTLGGAQIIEAVTHNSDSALLSPACTGEKVFTGLPAGTFAWTFAIGRNDASNWYSTINPTSASDLTALPLATTTYHVFQEVEP